MKLFTYFFLFLFSESLLARDVELSKFYNKYWKVTNKSIEYIKAGEIIVDSSVDNHKGNLQSFEMHVAAMHKKSCTKAIRKLFMYENYDDWVSFIKSSTYIKKNKLLTIKANHILLPFPMVVHIIVDRPKTPGIYHFSFPTGIFKGLIGKFIIIDHNSSCAFYAESHWKGKKTKIPNFVVELFSETLTKLGGELLFRKVK